MNKRSIFLWAFQPVFGLENSPQFHQTTIFFFSQWYDLYFNDFLISIFLKTYLQGHHVLGWLKQSIG